MYPQHKENLVKFARITSLIAGLALCSVLSIPAAFAQSRPVANTPGAKAAKIELGRDQPAQSRRQAHHLVDAGAAGEAGIAAFQTADRAEHALGQWQ